MNFTKTICQPAAIRIVSPEEFDAGTAQTPGSERPAAVSPRLGVDVWISRTMRFGSWFTAFTAICSSFVSMVG
jgi:hypothetical protein